MIHGDFSYWHLVYAIAEIGPAASDAMPIALSAAGERSSSYYRKEYSLAGSICVDRLIDGNAKSDLARIAPAQLIQFERYADSLLNNYDKDKDGRLSQVESRQMRRPPAGADSNNDGFLSRVELTTSSINSSNRMKLSRPLTVRAIVNAYLAGEKERKEQESRLPSVDRLVELIFQNYDLFADSNQLCIREVRNMSPPILIAEVDRDDDQMISKEELTGFLQGLNPQDWPLMK